MSNPNLAIDATIFDRHRQVQYWLRCAKTLLPTPYTSMESMRMSLAYFVVSAMDLLDILATDFSETVRSNYVDWIYHCQHPDGGFLGSPGLDRPNLGATLFALQALLCLRDDLGRVKGTKCLEWLRKLQKEDGTFGECLGENGSIQCGGGQRYCYMATVVCSILGGFDQEEPPIDVGSMLDYIYSSQTFQGGFCDNPGGEANGGLTYCAIATLSILGVFSSSESSDSSSRFHTAKYLGGRGSSSTIDLEGLTKWLVDRQTTYLEEYESDDEDPSTSTPDPLAPLAISPEELAFAGFNGRYNKLADTCYTFWVTASLEMIGKLSLHDSSRSRRYLLEKTQHFVGGFGKAVDEYPDIYHSYLGLAALSLINEPGISRLDPLLAITVKAQQHLERLKSKSANS
ncbi:MAG: hypothetical protein M1834_006402 [Cirrosporium novae-zelandiae]|nr:MAG: hypothetical protein M1834_006402 [Cirrosporium novae-zelandiae]